MPERYVLIGENVSSSPSPRMMNAAFEALGLDSVYETSNIGRNQLSVDFAKLRDAGVSGLNVTVPHKSSMVRFLDSLDEFSSRIGAVNTVKREGASYVGYNTDVDGVLGPLKSRGHSRIRTAFVLGTGGASRAVCEALRQLGCEELVVFSRDPRRAGDFLRFMGAALPGVRLKVTSIGSPPPWNPELVFNASPIGTKGIPLPPEVPRMLAEGSIVFDAVYFPVETELITQAKQRNCTTICGHEMLLHQGVKAVRIWTGRNAPVQVMKTALLETLGVVAS
ncbi:MAG TPA: shikimate dehydrogenase [Nitrososphaerales archaeon]|nr:shikimate dehydrogenase [Nitrososphaerales archaeon]